jgi:hypothetical protein
MKCSVDEVVSFSNLDLKEQVDENGQQTKQLVDKTANC